MALTKEQKRQLADVYQKHFAEAKNVIIIRQTNVPVNEMTTIRKGLYDAQGVYQVVKKRVMLKAIEGLKIDQITIDDLQGSVAVLCAYEDEYAPLKVVNKQNKSFQKAKAKFGFDYVGGWFDGKRHSGEYVTELANIPSQEELISKLLYLIKYPVQGLAMAASEIAKKGTSDDQKVKDLLAPATTADATPAPKAEIEHVAQEEPKAAATEEPKEGQVAETTEEPKEA